MNDSPFGPFRPFSVLWFPFALPAIALSALAWVLFFVSNAAFGYLFDVEGGAWAACAHFFENTRRSLVGLSFSTVDGTTGLYFAQLVVVLVLWAVFGVAACRVQALRLTREEYLGYREALNFGFRHAPSALVFPLIVGVLIALLWGTQALLGLLLRVPYLDAIAVLVLPLGYLLSFAGVGILLSSLFAMGMLPGAIAVERKGTLDAWGKCLNYLFARPLHVILYLVLLKVFLVDILLHYAFEVRVFHAWTNRALTGFGVGESFALIRVQGEDMTTYQAICGWIHRGVRAAVDLLVIGFVGSAFFAGFTGMFLVFRRDVDGIDVGEIDIEHDSRRDPDPSPQSSA